MKSAMLLLFASLAALPATMNLQPAVIVDCTYGVGVTQVNWSGASGPVTVRVISPTGPQLTALSDPAGSALTGVWVRDAMQFFLVNEAGAVEATAIAHVNCATGTRTIDAGLHGASYFPLQVGNTWVYRENSRIETGSYVTRTITETKVINGLVYYDLTSGGNLLGELRQDANGAVYILSNGTEQVYVDPASSAFQPATYSSPLGTFTDALRANAFGGLEMTNSTFVRGLGLVHTGVACSPRK